MASKYDNGNTGKKIVKANRSRSSQYYDKNPGARKKKGAYDRGYNTRPGQIKRRDSRNKARHEVIKKIAEQARRIEDATMQHRQDQQKYRKQPSPTAIKKATKKIKRKDIHHKDNNPLNNNKANLEVMSIKKNRQAALRKAYKVK